MRLKKTAPIARAHADDGQLDRFEPAQVVERQLDGRADRLAADPQLPASLVDLGDVGEVIAHEECVVRREQAVQVADRRLVVGWPVSEFDERLLAGKRLQDRFRPGAGGEVRRQIGTLLGQRRGRSQNGPEVPAPSASAAPPKCCTSRRLLSMALSGNA